MEARKQTVPVKIDEDVTIFIEARSLSGEQEVSSKILEF